MMGRMDARLFDEWRLAHRLGLDIDSWMRAAMISTTIANQWCGKDDTPIEPGVFLRGIAH